MKNLIVTILTIVLVKNIFTNNLFCVVPFSWKLSKMSLQLFATFATSKVDSRETVVREFTLVVTRLVLLFKTADIFRYSLQFVVAVPIVIVLLSFNFNLYFVSEDDLH